MSACRESRPMERKLDRFLTQLRTIDKILWSYSGKDIEREEYPLSSFLWVEEEIEEAHRIWMEFMDETRKEKMKVLQLNGEKYPPKNTHVSGNSTLEKISNNSIISALMPKA